MLLLYRQRPDYAHHFVSQRDGYQHPQFGSERLFEPRPLGAPRLLLPRAGTNRWGFA